MIIGKIYSKIGFMVALLFTAPVSAAPDVFGRMFDVEFGCAETACYACWQDNDGFYFQEVSKDTGFLTGSLSHYPIAPEPINRLTNNGPEVVRTESGFSCLGTSKDDSGLVWYNAQYAEVIEGTQGFVGSYGQSRFVCDTPRAFAFTMTVRDSYIVEALSDGYYVSPVTADGTATRWSDCDHYWLSRGGVHSQCSLDGNCVEVAAHDSLIISPLVLRSGDEYVAIENGDSSVYIYYKSEGGWILDHIASSPNGRKFLWSVELFEWKGRPWLVATATDKRLGTGDTVVYSLDSGEWTTVLAGRSYDPEAIELNDGKLGVYFLNNGITKFVVLE